jgi:hypothetical protein
MPFLSSPSAHIKRKSLHPLPNTSAGLRKPHSAAPYPAKTDSSIYSSQKRQLKTLPKINTAS